MTSSCRMIWLRGCHINTTLSITISSCMVIVNGVLMWHPLNHIMRQLDIIMNVTHLIHSLFTCPGSKLTACRTPSWSSISIGHGSSSLSYSWAMWTIDDITCVLGCTYISIHIIIVLMTKGDDDDDDDSDETPPIHHHHHHHHHHTKAILMTWYLIIVHH